MAAPAIRIRVGASLDANVSGVFKPLVQAARDARQAIEDEMARAYAAIRGEGAARGGGKGGPYRTMVRDAERAADRIVETEKKKQRKIEQEERRAQRRKESAARYAERIKDRHFLAEQRRQEREQAGATTGRGKRIREIGGGALETMGKIGRGALGVAGSVARGAGVQTDLASYVANYVDAETKAVNLVNASFQGRKDETRRDPSELLAVAKATADQYAFSRTAVLEGLAAFTSKTGELDVALQALPELAKLARATGTQLADMVAAAGEADKALGNAFDDPIQKGAAVNQIMRTIAQQGKLGAVEIKDLATQMGKLSAVAPMYEGDVVKNVELMGALTQFSIGGGGATSAAGAATSVARLADIFKTPARAAKFQAKEIDPFIKEGVDKGKIRNPIELIIESLEKTKADPLEFKKLFASVVGAKPAERLAATYRAAESKQKGTGAEAIRAEVMKFTQRMTVTDVSEAAAGSMGTTAAKVQLFNNKLEDVAGRIASKLLPALEKAAPSIVKVADMFAKMVDFAVDNPGKAAGLALAASIAKASIGNVVSGGIEKLMSGAATGGPGGKALGALAIAATAITIASVGKMVIDSVGESTDKGTTQSVNADLVAANAISALKGAQVVGGQEAQEKALVTGREQEAALKQRIQAAEDPTSFFGALFGSKTFEQRGREQTDAEKLGDLKADLAKLQAEMAKVGAALGKPLQVQGTVNVGNQPGPTANLANTTK